MSEVFVISDTHFGHRGILSFPQTKRFRPFDTIEEHDQELIKRWNNIVTPKDIVWHLGDFCFGKRYIPIASELNGSICLILGNHDTYPIDFYLQYFDKVLGITEYKGMLLSHIPVHPCQNARYYMNIHGHLHTNHILRPDGSKDNHYFNASCENTGLAPIPIDEALNFWAENQG